MELKDNAFLSARRMAPAAPDRSSFGSLPNSGDHARPCRMGEPEVPPGNPPEVPQQEPPELPQQTPPLEAPPETPPEAPPAPPPEIPPPPEEA